jgi:hypothetical protein
MRALLAHVATKGDNKNYLRRILCQGDGRDVICAASDGYTAITGATRQTGGAAFRITISAGDLTEVAKDTSPKGIATFEDTHQGWIAGGKRVEVDDLYPDMMRVMPSVAEIMAAKDSLAVQVSARKLAEVVRSVCGWCHMPVNFHPHVVHIHHRDMAAVIAPDAIGIVTDLVMAQLDESDVPSFLRAV